eukprot:CAMPEP_0175748728 /NCGR_PEP_ID=MMETSP0097-20121207/59775_1 /TAXON_ID=311494 /ORGANISM="Alexandrium monilatum, Strain CCMP3105" /LENGTH=40 /DNA_ID= /DNA_START= /DNA_END= /DNA_ORIENTATION=
MRRLQPGTARCCEAQEHLSAAQPAAGRDTAHRTAAQSGQG